MMRSALTVLLMGFTAAAAGAGVLPVRADRQGPHPTIQAALDAAAAGDTVSLGPGTYTGPGNRDLDFAGKPVCLLGDPAHPETRVIDLGAEPDSVRGFFFHSGETAAAQVRGLTVAGGIAPGPQGRGGMGGAVLCVGASPTLADCILEGNRAHTGGAVALENSAARLEACRLIRNTGEIGGAVSITGGEPIVWGCDFQGNTAARGGAIAGYETRLLVERTFFNANTATQGGALALDRGSELELSGSLLSGNYASFGGGIFARTTHLACRRVTLAGNSAGAGGGLYLDARTQARLEATIVAFSVRGGAVGAVPQATVAIACSVVFGNAGGNWTGPLAPLRDSGGNLDRDPRLADPRNGDFTPLPSSPCRDPECGMIGALE